MGRSQSGAESPETSGFVPRRCDHIRDPMALTYLDPDHSVEEQRFITVGSSNTGQQLIVAHSDRGEKIRIISARKTTRREREQYEQDK
jgi:uncharacterized protein